MPIPSILKNAAYDTITRLKGNAHGHVRLPVLRGPAKGLVFELDIARDSGYILGKYDKNILQTLRDIVMPGWVVWDVGTYLGFYTVLFSRLVGPAGTVVAIEPDPRNLERTRLNLHLNQFELQHFVPVAIGAPLGEIDFLLSDDTNSHIPGVYIGGPHMKQTYVERDLSKSKLRIHCNSLDEIFFEKGLPAPNLIKIDIEGAELQALQHVHRLCREVQPILILELHNAECDREAWNFARRVDYILYSAEDRRELLSPEEVHGTLLCMPRKQPLVPLND